MDNTEGWPAVAVVGCGYWGRNLVRSFAQLGALRAVVDPAAEVAAAIASEYGAESRTFAEVLADPSIGAVSIAAPARQHAELALAALNAGKHVFVEKPLALRIDDAEQVVAAAEAAGLTLMVGHLLQYHPAFLALADLVAEGALGDLRYLYSNRLNLGKIRREENILWSFAPHDISMLLALAGEEPSHVTAVGSTFLSTGVPDVTTTHLRFPSGPEAHVFVSWLHPFKEQRLVVVGSEAMVVFDDLEPWDSKLEMYAHGVEVDGDGVIPVKAEGQRLPVEQSEPLRLECLHFLECVASGRTPRTDGPEGLRVLKVLDAAQRALVDPEVLRPLQDLPEAEGRPVEWSGHELTFVGRAGQLGPGTQVGLLSQVCSGARIGADCKLGSNVHVGPGTSVGDRCELGNNVSIEGDVVLGDDVWCGPSTVFTDRLGACRPGADGGASSQTHVHDGVRIGANVTIGQGLQIGAHAAVIAGSVVDADVPAHALVSGAPARRTGWVSHLGDQLDAELRCPTSGRQYVERDGSLDELGPDDIVSPGRK